MYADDNSGSLPSSWPIGFDGFPVNPYSWCPGWASLDEPGGYDYGPSPDYDCTNIYSLQQGVIWPYLKTAAVYHCPADRRALDGMPVLRSYSMNSWMNGKSYDDPTGTSTFTTPDDDGTLTYVLFRKENQITLPAQMWCLIDEDGSTINDSLFVVDMGAENGITDLPSTLHGGSYELTFADGHGENVGWLAPGSDWNVNQSAPDPDWQKLKTETTVKR